MKNYDMAAKLLACDEEPWTEPPPPGKPPLRGFIRFLITAAVLLGVLFLGGKYLHSLTVQRASLDRGWNLILVNEDYHVPQDYEVELVTLRNNQQVDRRIYPDLQEMFDDMRAQGIYPVVASGYRTHERQEELLEEKIREYQDMGHSRWKARRMALQWVSKPGASEHQLGIAVDINQEVGRSTAQEVYDWLAENAHLYGFIRRYPPEKEEITGIGNEPWHYRYVGEAAALEIYENGLCLEEYLQEDSQ